MKPLKDGRARIGPARSAGPFTIRRIAYPAGQRQPPHSHAITSVTLILSGAIRESAGAGEETGESLSVVVKPAGVEHADEMGPRGARTLQVAIEPDAAAEIGAGGLDRWRWVHDLRAVAPLVDLARLASRHALEDGAPDDDALRDGALEQYALEHGALEQEPLERDALERDALEEGVLEAVGALDPPDPASAPLPDWLARVREALDDQLETGITVQTLAREVGAHPVSVSRAFRRHYGRTISAYRRQERVRRAAARIAGAGTLSRIAFATGHADHPHLCREFRRVTGLSPSEYRRLLG